MRAPTYVRRYETDYAGAWRGHCSTRGNAILAASRHIVKDGYKNATVTDKATGEVISRLSLSEDRRTLTITTVTSLRKESKK